MSVQAITWTLGKAPSLAAQAVLFSLGNHADEWGVTYIGQDTLAAECSCRKATISDNLRRLEEAGLIARVQRRDARGRRTSDHVVLGPLHPDRGAMSDADKRAVEKHGADVCAFARRQDTGGVSGQPDTANGEPRYVSRPVLDTLGVPEPSVKPSEKQGSSSSTAAGVPDSMRADADALLRAKTKVAGKIVTEREMAIAAAALDEFNRQMEGDFGLGAHVTRIVGRVRERPSWDAAKHVRLVQSAWRVRWWERNGNRRRPSPQVIYGNSDVFEQVAQDAADEAVGREIVGDQRLKSKVWWDGRAWDELSETERQTASEMYRRGLRPWERPEEPEAVPVNGHGEGLTAENFLLAS